MTAEDQKKAAAIAALEYIKPGMKVGLGTGSTANHFITALAEKVRQGGLDIECVATSRQSFQLASQLGLKMTNLDKQPRLDVCVDGADEFDGNFQLIKGGGGAMLIEKIVATSARYMVVIADESKKVSALGKFPLPIEINPFGQVATRIAVERAANRLGLSGTLAIRQSGSEDYYTDGGHLILDASFGRIPDAQALSAELAAIPGVVEHGLFINIASLAIIAGPAGARTLKAI